MSLAKKQVGSAACRLLEDRRRTRGGGGEGGVHLYGGGGGWAGQCRCMIRSHVEHGPERWAER